MRFLRPVIGSGIQFQPADTVRHLQVIPMAMPVDTEHDFTGSVQDFPYLCSVFYAIRFSVKAMMVDHNAEIRRIGYRFFQPQHFIRRQTIPLLDERKI